jgi:hypothetical protein
MEHPILEVSRGYSAHRAQMAASKMEIRGPPRQFGDIF